VLNLHDLIIKQNYFMWKFTTFNLRCSRITSDSGSEIYIFLVAFFMLRHPVVVVAAAGRGMKENKYSDALPECRIITRVISQQQNIIIIILR